MDKGLILSIFLVITAWLLVIFGLYIIAKSLVPIQTEKRAFSRLFGVIKVLGSFSVIGALLYSWFLLTKKLVLRLKSKSRAS